MKTKRERFENVAAKRVQRVLDAIDSLEKCSNPVNYEYSEKDINKMINSIRSKVKYLDDSYRGKFNRSTRKTFNF